MIDYLKEQVREISDNQRARLLVREYLQARILEALQEAGVFTDWCFIGGTALRFLYHLPRFSEDLDFSLRKRVGPAEQEGYDILFRKTVKTVKNAFAKEHYTVDYTLHLGHPVKSSFIKFPGLLYMLQLSPHEHETVSVKIELDSNPPEGAGFDTTIIRKYSLLNLQHYDKASLFAGKLHAVLSRNYTKGRDIYDLLWYLADPLWPGPNIQFLRNALEQTCWPGLLPDNRNWRVVINNALSRVDWQQAVKDVLPFLEKPNESALLTKENLEKLLLSNNKNQELFDL